VWVYLYAWFDSNEWSKRVSVFVSVIWHIAMSEVNVWVYLYVWFDRQQWVKKWMHECICTHDLTHTNEWMSMRHLTHSNEWRSECICIHDLQHSKKWRKECVSVSLSMVCSTARTKDWPAHSAPARRPTRTAPTACLPRGGHCSENPHSLSSHQPCQNTKQWVKKPFLDSVQCALICFYVRGSRFLNISLSLIFRCQQCWCNKIIKVIQIT